MKNRFVNNEIAKEYITIDDVNEVIYSLYHLLSKYSNKHYTGLFYGYFDVEQFEKKFSIAYDYLENLRNLKFRMSADSQCSCMKDAGKLVEDARKLADGCPSVRLDLITDTLNYEQWILENPYKVPREVWENCLYVRCDNITYTLARDLNNANKKCELVYDLVRAINECKVQYNLENKTKNCAIEYDILVSEHKCQLTYDEYLNIHKCGGSFNLVKSVLNCGAKINVDPVLNCIDVTYNLKKYSINCYE